MSFLFPFTGLVAGILAGFLWLPLWLGAGIIIFSLLVYFIFTIIGSDPVTSFKTRHLHQIWILILFCGIGVVIADYHKPYDFIPPSKNEIITLEGTVDNITYLTSGDLITIKINGIEVEGNELLPVRNFEISALVTGMLLKEGDYMRFCCPGSNIRENRYQSAFDQITGHRSYYFFLNNTSIKILGEDNSLKYKFIRIRNKIETYIENSSLNRSTSEFLISLLLGDRSFLSSDTKDQFREAGVSHILALSGMHVAIITLFLTWLFFPLKIIGLRKTWYLLTIIFIWVFTFLTGASPSTLRAALMSTFLMTAIMVQRKKSSGNALLFAVSLILLFSPQDIFNISLQMSFICVGAILLFLKPLNKIDLHTHPLLHKLNSLLLISIISAFSIWTLVSYYFGTVSLIFIPANILILPTLPIFMGLAIIYTLLLITGIDPGFIAKLLDSVFGIYKEIMDIPLLSENTLIEYKVSGLTVLFWIALLLLCGIFLNSFHIRKNG